MARTSRNNMKNSSFFHIMVQGINKENIFETQKNKEKYLKLIYDNNEDIEIIAYCIMDNHVHILVQTNEINNIGNWMKKSNTRYAIYYNKRNDRVGYVFRDRYKAQPIRNKKHLYLCVEYIHNNPVKAGICKDKKEFKFSSYLKIYQGNQIECQKKIAEILVQCKSQEKYKTEELEEKFEFMEEKMEEKEEKCQKIINSFLKNKKLSVEDLKKEKPYLREIVKILKYENNISYRLMEKYLAISREKLRMLIVKSKR